MKKLLTLIAILILSASSMAPGPEIIKENKEVMLIQNFQIEEKIDTSKNEKLNKQEELEKIQRTYDIQQKNVMRQIETLEKQQKILDSLLNTKKDTIE